MYVCCVYVVGTCTCTQVGTSNRIISKVVISREALKHLYIQYKGMRMLVGIQCTCSKYMYN